MCAAGGGCRGTACAHLLSHCVNDGLEPLAVATPWGVEIHERGALATGERQDICARRDLRPRRAPAAAPSSTRAASAPPSRPMPARPPSGPLILLWGQGRGHGGVPSAPRPSAGGSRVEGRKRGVQRPLL